jgi:probable F420-dependent oxidoreductase
MVMAEFPIRVGVQIQPQQGSWEGIRDAFRRVDESDADTLYTWDHFHPLYDDPDGAHFECWTMLAAMAEITHNVRFGALVTCNSYRNPELLADMARTVDHMSGGRLIFGIGSGWFQRDYDEFGYEFGTAPSRLRDLDAALPRIEQRWAKSNPLPVQHPIPILIGGGGEKVTLRIVAQYAQMWNGFGDPEKARHKNAVIDAHCAKLGRDPTQIERSIGGLKDPDAATLDAYVDAGITHFIFSAGGPDWDLSRLQKLLDWRDSRSA